MIVGSGDIAKAICEGGLNKPDLCWFAAGVSNSAETRESEYQREVDLLLAQDWRALRLVYFSSLCVHYADTRYAEHKQGMEMLVRELFPRHAIVRVGNITWGDNPHTLINFLRAQALKGEPPTIQDVYRYPIDKGEFLSCLGTLPDENVEVDLIGRRLKVQDIYDIYVRSEWERA